MVSKVEAFWSEKFVGPLQEGLGMNVLLSSRY